MTVGLLIASTIFAANRGQQPDRNALPSLPSKLVFEPLNWTVPLGLPYRDSLSNGLRVTTRHVPRAAGVSITLCYEVGAEHDPIGREGLAALAAEILFTGPSGDQPERTRAEMASLRPLGWNIKIGQRYTELSEVAAPDQFWTRNRIR